MRLILNHCAIPVPSEQLVSAAVRPAALHAAHRSADRPSNSSDSRRTRRAARAAPVCPLPRARQARVRRVCAERARGRSRPGGPARRQAGVEGSRPRVPRYPRRGVHPGGVAAARRPCSCQGERCVRGRPRRSVAISRCGVRITPRLPSPPCPFRQSSANPAGRTRARSICRPVIAAPSTAPLEQASKRLACSREPQRLVCDVRARAAEVQPRMYRRQSSRLARGRRTVPLHSGPSLTPTPTRLLDRLTVCACWRCCCSHPPQAC